MKGQRPAVIQAIHARLDLLDTVAAEGLAVRRSQRGARYFECPACRKPAKGGVPAAMTRDGRGWKCVRCDEHGDVIDVLRIVRGVEVKDAVRLACELAGIAPDEFTKPIPAWKRAELEAARPAVASPEIEAVPSAPPLLEDERAMRLRAVRLAAAHYLTLAGDDAGSRLDFLAETLCGLRPHEHRFSPSLVAPMLTRTGVALAYLRTRLGLADGEALPDAAAELVGVCPGPDTGLRTDLYDHGGPELVAAAVDAGIMHRRRDGSVVEALAGRLVYVWTDDTGRAVYLAGRAVPELVAADALKALGLMVYNPDRRGDRRGVPRIRWPFGVKQAREIASRAGSEGVPSIFIVEGELDALAALCAGVCAVATGGTAKLDNATGRASLRVSLAGLSPIVAFDADENPTTQQKTDERARSLALAVGGRWVPAGSFAHAVAEVLAEGPCRPLRAQA